jgi:hypothetical protein
MLQIFSVIYYSIMRDWHTLKLRTSYIALRNKENDSAMGTFCILLRYRLACDLLALRVGS